MLPNSYADITRSSYKHSNIEKYLPLVKRVAGRLAMSLPSYIDEDDLVGHGVFGLLDAIDRFDPSRGVKFETYASLRIRGAIIDGLRMMDWVPHSARQRVKRVKEAFLKIENLLGRPADLQEVASELSVTIKEVEEILVQSQVLSLTYFDEIAATADGEDAGPLINNLIDVEAQQAFKSIEKEEQKKVLSEAIDKLPDKEKIVLGLYYQEELTLKEIAAVLDLTEARISQLHSKAILRLRGKLGRHKKTLL